jgi:phage protein U
MFALLGDVVFQIVGSPEDFGLTRDYHFVEQEVIGAPPRLNWIANGLRRLELQMILHASFTVPALDLAQLETAAENHRAMPLVLGSGRLLGHFVIERMSIRMEQMTSLGEPIAMRVGVSLREWVADAASSAGSSSFAGLPPLAIVDSSAGPASGSRAAAAGAGVSVLRQTVPASRPPTAVVQANDIASAVIVRSIRR